MPFFMLIMGGISVTAVLFPRGVSMSRFTWCNTKSERIVYMRESKETATQLHQDEMN